MATSYKATNSSTNNDTFCVIEASILNSDVAGNDNRESRCCHSSFSVFSAKVLSVIGLCLYATSQFCESIRLELCLWSSSFLMVAALWLMAPGPVLIGWGLMQIISTLLCTCPMDVLVGAAIFKVLLLGGVPVEAAQPPADTYVFCSLSGGLLWILGGFFKMYKMQSDDESGQWEDLSEDKEESMSLL